MVSVPKEAACVLQARSILPFMTIAQEPQTADLHDERNERVPSISSRILFKNGKDRKPGDDLDPIGLKPRLVPRFFPVKAQYFEGICGCPYQYVLSIGL